MPMITKIGRMVTCHKGLPPIKSHNTLITWSCDIMKTKIIIIPLADWLWLPGW